MTLGTTETFGILNAEQANILRRWLPNLLALHENTTYNVFREFVPRKEAVEITIYYREPGETKMRIDIDISEDSLAGASADEIHPGDVKITYWGEAVRGVV